MLSENRATAGV